MSKVYRTLDNDEVADACLEHTGHCSDDTLEYFICGIIAKGKQAYKDLLETQDASAVKKHFGDKNPGVHAGFIHIPNELLTPWPDYTKYPHNTWEMTYEALMQILTSRKEDHLIRKIEHELTDEKPKKCFATINCYQESKIAHFEDVIIVTDRALYKIDVNFWPRCFERIDIPGIDKDVEDAKIYPDDFPVLSWVYLNTPNGEHKDDL